MNLIICDRNCTHQEEGYCTLDQISSLTNNLAAKCGYFTAPDKLENSGKVQSRNLFPYDSNRL